MFDLAVIRTGIRFGVMCGFAAFLVVLALYLAGADPYGEKSFYSLLFLPIFIFLGVRYYKKFNESEIGFLRALSVAFSISMYASITSALLLYIFATFAGPEAMELHVREAREWLEANKEMMVKQTDEQTYQEVYEQIREQTPYDLAAKDFLIKIFPGIAFSLVAGVFFRK